jgi:hypothetical protein
MSAPRLDGWHVTAFEIALDLELPRLLDPATLAFSGKAEPRICLVAAFAWTSQLKRVVAAVDRALPARLPSGLRIAPSLARGTTHANGVSISIQPMLALMRLQAALVRAIEPGLAHDGTPLSFGQARDVREAERFVREFIPSKALPAFEPAYAATGFDATNLRAVGITIYRLGYRGTPESILAHWASARNRRISNPPGKWTTAHG